MKKILTVLCAITWAGILPAQTFTITDSMQWKAYDDFNTALLDKTKNIYKADTEQPSADHRGNGARDNDRSGCAAAIWCQAIYYDMVINAYNRAKEEGNEELMKKYKTLHNRIYNGEKSHYVNFNFDDPNTNNGWFVYDDIMWWTCALARAYEAFGTKAYLTYSEKSFCRVWYGSSKVGDDGSYADPARFEGAAGGGMFWEWQPIAKANPHKPGDFRSACINFPTVIAACLLHQLVPEGRNTPTAARPTQQTKEWYLEKAKEVYAWADKTLVNSSGRVADGIHGGGPEYSDHLYNQATYIGASCLLYKLTGEKTYLTKAQKAADYVISNMCTGSILKFENGYEQGVYTAIYAQYMKMLIYDCGLNKSYTNKYLKHIQRQMQKGWDNRDQERGIQAGNFSKKTESTDVVESYGGSGLPALMLMFPAHITVDDIMDDVEEVPAAQASVSSDIYTIDGRLVKKNATHGQVASLGEGLYIYQQKKLLVRK